MNIEVRRGFEQIGGCITEISTVTTRIFIDMGQNLSYSGRLPLNPGIWEQHHIGEYFIFW